MGIRGLNVNQAGSAPKYHEQGVKHVTVRMKWGRTHTQVMHAAVRVLITLVSCQGLGPGNEGTNDL